MSMDLDFCPPVFLKPPSPTVLHCVCHHGLLACLCFVPTKPPRNHLKELLPAAWILETLQRLPDRSKQGQGCLTWYPTSQLHSPTFPVPCAASPYTFCDRELFNIHPRFPDPVPPSSQSPSLSGECDFPSWFPDKSLLKIQLKCQFLWGFKAPWRLPNHASRNAREGFCRDR